MFKLTSKLVCNFVFWAIALSIFAIGIQSHTTDKFYLNGLIFYDFKTNRTLLPPIVTPFKYTQSSRLPLIGRPCACQNLNCGCCVGVNIQQIHFNQHLCTNFTYDPNAFSIQMDVIMNESNMYTNTISARNPPPLCVPIPIPYIPLSTEMCVKFFNVFTPGRNLHMCMDMQMKVQKAPIIVLHFDCMRMGQDGLALVKPEQYGGLDGISPPQIESPSQETVLQTQSMGSSSIDPPQTDYDVYDEVLETKIEDNRNNKKEKN